MISNLATVLSFGFGSVVNSLVKYSLRVRSHLSPQSPPLVMI